MAVMAFGVRGMGALSHKGNSGPGTDPVQEERGGLGYDPIIDILFHEDPVVEYLTFAVFYGQAGLSVSRSARSGLAARPWLGATHGF
jgi:hypothetical protein